MTAPLKSRAVRICRALLARRRSLRARFRAGYTLVELVLAMTILGTLASMAVPRWQQAIDKAKVARAIGDIKAIQTDIDGSDPLPADLAQIGRGGMLDPWGNPYQYFFHGGNRGTAKKDRFQVPLNSEYDLWSNGKDGATALALTAEASKDDIVRANDSGFVGLATNY
ncbi:MAG: prepilin-type N-terminal cleavage/methylation domain-containing protein [Gemmatimonadota bacterium]|nr:MAG: prepilin-type N-terminal cleavage/methylation domain-containing protein [Gemmatimonadota bacterium]